MTNYNPKPAFIVRESTFPETKAWRSSSSVPFAVAMCGNSCVGACDFSHISSVPWIPELMNLLTSAFPQRLSRSLAVISLFFLPPSLGRPAWARTSPFTSLQATLLCCSTRSLDLRPRSIFWIFMTSITPWTARSASTPSSSGCGAELPAVSGELGKAQSIEKTCPAFGGGCWLPQESWNMLVCLSLGLWMSAVRCCVCKMQSKRIDSYAPRGEAWKCQLGYTETTGKLKLPMGNFPATVTLESLISKQTKIPNKKMFLTSEGPHGFQVLKPVQKMLQVFCLCFCL